MIFFLITVYTWSASVFAYYDFVICQYQYLNFKVCILRILISCGDLVILTFAHWVPYSTIWYVYVYSTVKVKIVQSECVHFFLKCSTVQSRCGCLSVELLHTSRPDAQSDLGTSEWWCNIAVTAERPPIKRGLLLFTTAIIVYY